MTNRTLSTGEMITGAALLVSCMAILITIDVAIANNIRQDFASMRAEMIDGRQQMYERFHLRALQIEARQDRFDKRGVEYDNRLRRIEDLILKRGYIP